jgi:hypothetical protein
MKSSCLSFHSLISKSAFHGLDVLRPPYAVAAAKNIANVWLKM